MKKAQAIPFLRRPLIAFVILPLFLASLAGCAGRSNSAIPDAPAAQNVGVKNANAFMRSITPAKMMPDAVAIPPMGGLDVVRPAMSERRPQSAIQPLNFTQLNGAATAIAASPDGTFWVLSTQGIPSGDRFIYHYTNGAFVNVPGAASEIAVGPDSTPWVVNAAGGIYHLVNGSFVGIAGAASQISVGGTSGAPLVDVISNQSPGPYGSGIYQYNVNAGTWSQLPGAGTTVSASIDSGTYSALNILPGGFYVTNAVGGIYYYNVGVGFEQLPGAAVSLAPTATGGLFALGNPGSIPHGIYYNDLATGQWTQMPGAAVSLSANSTNVYAVGSAGGIYASSLAPLATVALSPSLGGAGLGLFPGVNPQTFSVSETGYAGAFQIAGASPSVAVTCAPANCVPAQAGGTVAITFAGSSAGSGTIVISDQSGNSTAIPYRVSLRTTYTPFGAGTQISNVPAGAVGSDGNLWFIDFKENTNCSSFNRVSTSGVLLTSYPVSASALACGIGNNRSDNVAAGPDSAIWFTFAALDGAQFFSPTFTGTQYIGRISTAPSTLGAISTFPMHPPQIETASGVVTAQNIAFGSDGALWFTSTIYFNYIGRMSTAGVDTYFPVSVPSGAWVRHIVAGPDGALWFLFSYGQIGRITTAGVITTYPVPNYVDPSGNSLTIQPQSNFVVGPDGNLWFTGYAEQPGVAPEAAFVCKVTMSGITTCKAESNTGPFSTYTSLAIGPDNALWAASQLETIDNQATNAITRIDPSFNVTVYTIPSFSTPPYGDQPQGIFAGPDGALWYGSSDLNEIGRVQP